MRHTSPVVRERFTRAVAPASGPEAAAELFELCNRIALLRYETSESTGTLLITSRSRVDVEPILLLATPLRLTEVGGVRKMLQMSDQELGVLCDGSEVYGLGRHKAPADSELVVKFQPHGRWRLSQGGRQRLAVDVAAPPEPEPRVSAPVFIHHLEQAFGPLPPKVATRLWQLIEAAADQARGTTVLITPQSATEALRLRGQCTVVVPAILTPQTMKNITAIDGTVMIDLDGVCHALGAILDGQVSSRGNRTRGGRFNSARMYVDTSPDPCLIVTVSQDGPVDFLYTATRPRR